jgi:hypothetical protein
MALLRSDPLSRGCWRIPLSLSPWLDGGDGARLNQVGPSLESAEVGGRKALPSAISIVTPLSEVNLVIRGESDIRGVSTSAKTAGDGELTRTCAGCLELLTCAFWIIFPAPSESRGCCLLLYH